tara:strand:+ start:173 stop:481 length:309 start_codon:yes stop_codon:yes gene_type:complete
MGLMDKMKEAKDMYSNVKKAKDEISKIIVEGASNNHLVVVEIQGNYKIISIKIDSNLYDQQKDVLENLIKDACNNALEKVEKEIKNKMGNIMNLPSGFKLPF